MTEKYIIQEELSSLKRGDKETFLIYFSKCLGSSSNWRGEGRFYEDDSGVDPEHFINTDSLSVDLGGNIIELEFVSHWKNSELTTIEVSCPMGETTAWREFVGRKVSQAFAEAFGQQRAQYFFRGLFMYIGPGLDGAYYISGWRIAPATPPRPMFCEQGIYFDAYVEGIDHNHALSKFQAYSKEVMAILSVIFNKGIYSIPLEFRWVHLSGNESDSLQLGFRDSEPYPTQMPDKDPTTAGKYIEPDKVLHLSAEQSTLCAPNNLRKLYRAYESIDENEKQAFLNAARLFQLSLTAGRASKTLYTSYQIAAIDALAKPIRENNKNKNAILAIVQRYMPGAEGVVGQLYESVRSAHFHQGFFSNSDTQGIHIRPFMGPEHLIHETDIMRRHNITRTVMISWLTDRIV